MGTLYASPNSLLKSRRPVAALLPLPTPSSCWLTLRLCLRKLLARTVARRHSIFLRRLLLPTQTLLNQLFSNNVVLPLLVSVKPFTLFSSFDDLLVHSRRAKSFRYLSGRCIKLCQALCLSGNQNQAPLFFVFLFCLCHDKRKFHFSLDNVQVLHLITDFSSLLYVFSFSYKIVVPWLSKFTCSIILLPVGKFLPLERENPKPDPTCPLGSIRLVSEYFIELSQVLVIIMSP